MSRVHGSYIHNSVDDLIALRKFKKSRQGISINKLNAGDGKAKKRAREEKHDQGPIGLLKPTTSTYHDDDQ